MLCLSVVLNICVTCGMWPLTHPGCEDYVLELDIHPAVTVVQTPVVGVAVFQLHQHGLALRRLQQR